MAECGYSEDCKYFAILSDDGRLRVWDTESNILKQQFTPDLHLSAPPTCLQWILLGSNTVPTKKGKKRKSNQDNITISEKQQCIALGCKNGKVLIYSVAKAAVETVLEDSKHETGGKNVTALDWHQNYGLFSCTDKNTLCEWNISESCIKNTYDVNFDAKNKHANKITAIKIVPNSQSNNRYIVIASHQLRVWHLESGTVVKSMVGHPSGVGVLKIAQLPSKCLLMSGSKNERLLSFWDITISETDHTSSTKSSKSSDVLKIINPSYNFVLEDSPRHVDLLLNEGERGCYVNISAVTRSGVLHYYGHVLNGTSTKPIKPSVTVQIATDDAKPLLLQCCHFIPESPTSEFVIGYKATPTKYIFEKIIPDLSTKTQVLIRESPSIESARRKSKHEEKENSESVDKEPTLIEPMGGVVSRKRVTAGADVEVPMESRLANLTIDRSKSAVSQNLTKLLIQGLHSGDKEIILAVLQKEDHHVAYKTLSHLPSIYIPQLIDNLTEMASSKVSQCKSVCVWLNALLRCHSAILLATINSKSTADKLSKLVTVLTQRRSHLNQLLNLKGKLELTMKQRSNAEHNSEEKAILEYHDTSSDDDMEVDLNNSSSDENDDDALSWNEDKIGAHENGVPEADSSSGDDISDGD